MRICILLIKKIILPVCAILVIGLIVYYLYPEDSLPADVKVEKLVVCKSKRKLHVYSDGNIVKTYRISLGKQPVGPKQFEGDKKTPEGIYYINDKNPNSRYHKNLGVSYPDKKDIEYAGKHGKSPGGDIKIHGLRNGTGFMNKFHHLKDWTLGCIAVTNKEIDELYNAVPIGTVIEIQP